MGEAQSKECADGKETDNLSVEDAESDINILRGLAENEGSITITEYINETLNRWKKEEVKIAVTGRSATGKSTFINTIRNLRPGDDGFAKAGSGDTTITPTLYKHPTNNKITFCDLPGYSSTIFKKEDYISEMKISDYDFILIFFNNVVGEDEIWLVRELRKLGKPFALVRSKIDIDIENAKYDGNDEKMVILEITKKIQKALQKNPELKDTKGIFLISSRTPDLGEMSDLLRYVEENIDDLKALALLFSLHSITKKSLVRKHKMIQKRLVLVTALVVGISAIPVPYVDVVNIGLLEHEVYYYMNVFEVQPEKNNSLKDFDHSLLKCSALLEANACNNMLHFITSKVGTFGKLIISKYLLKLIIPFFGSAISAANKAWTIYTFLDDMLQDIKHDAMLIHEHIYHEI